MNGKEYLIDVHINLDLESEEPIYTQLVQQIIAGIAKGELQPGERLPSVRSLAADIGINLHTVNKAYQQLKHKGFILIHRQRGVVIHPDGPPQADETYRKYITDQIHPFIAESICRGIDDEEFIQMCRQIFNEFKEGESK